MTPVLPNFICRVDAAIKVLESLSVQGRSVEIDPPEILKQISLQKFKTIKGSIDERDSLRRSLEQAQDTFYVSENDKFGLVKFKPKAEPNTSGKPKVKEKRGRPPLDRSGQAADRTNRTTSASTTPLNTATMNTESNTATINHQTNPPLNSKLSGKGKKKKDSADVRQRKLSTEDLFAPESPLIGINLKDYINEDTFNQLSVSNKVTILNQTCRAVFFIPEDGPATDRNISYVPYFK